MSPVYLYAAEAAFQSIFRLTVQEFTFVAKHIKSMLSRRRDKRGRKPIPLHIIMAVALLYLANGLTYKNDRYLNSQRALGGKLSWIQNSGLSYCIHLGKRASMCAFIHARRQDKACSSFHQVSHD